MDRNLSSYAKRYRNWLDPEISKKIVAGIEKNHWEQHQFYNVSDGSYGTRSGDKELDISYTADPEIEKYVMQRIWDAYLQYVNDLNFSWWNGWNGFSKVRFNRYKETRLMAEHCDHIHSLFDGQTKGIPVMTALGLLNDDFEGGEFVMWGDEVVPFEAGDIYIFPSCFLYPHRIDPVKSGIRYSYVSWAW